MGKFLYNPTDPALGIRDPDPIPPLDPHNCNPPPLQPKNKGALWVCDCGQHWTFYLVVGRPNYEWTKLTRSWAIHQIQDIRDDHRSGLRTWSNS